MQTEDKMIRIHVEPCWEQCERGYTILDGECQLFLPNNVSHGNGMYHRKLLITY